MKLANVRLKNGTRTVVAQGDSEELVDLAKIFGGQEPTVRGLLEDGQHLLEAARQGLPHATSFVSEADIESFLPVCEEDSKVFCVGLNYGGHAKELGVGIPKNPSIFARYGTTCIGHGQNIPLPKSSSMVDWEGELALVIGTSTKYVGEDNALDAIVGATIFNDVSMRDFQERLPKITLAKNFDGSGPIGPWLVTTDEIANLEELDLVTRVNGEVMQKSSTRDFIFSVPYLVDLISQVCRLRPGDVIATGTPEGVGWAHKPEPKFLQDGDVVEVEIECLGTLRNTCRNEITKGV